MPGVLQSMQSQRIGHNLVTEQHSSVITLGKKNNLFKYKLTQDGVYMSIPGENRKEQRILVIFIVNMSQESNTFETVSNIVMYEQYYKIY